VPVITSAPVMVVAGRGAGAPSGPVLLANDDLVNPVYVSPQQVSATQNGCEAVVPPLGTLGLDGSQTKYAACSAGETAQLFVIAGGTSWAPSPQQAAEQIALLGLMKDSTGQTIVTSTAATTASINNLTSTGVPPNVPNIKSADAVLILPGATPLTFFTFPANGRLWDVSLSFALATTAAFAGGLSPVYARVITGSGIDIAIVELAISGPSQFVPGNADLSLNGLAVALGDTLILDINAGVPLAAGATMRASCTVLYSVP
jgi:hypothetical protein